MVEEAVRAIKDMASTYREENQTRVLPQFITLLMESLSRIHGVAHGPMIHGAARGLVMRLIRLVLPSGLLPNRSTSAANGLTMVILLLMHQQRSHRLFQQTSHQGLPHRSHRHFQHRNLPLLQVMHPLLAAQRKAQPRTQPRTQPKARLPVLLLVYLLFHLPQQHVKSVSGIQIHFSSSVLMTRTIQQIGQLQIFSSNTSITH